MVPRAWSHLLGVVSGTRWTPETRTPEAWRDYVREQLGVDRPAAMTDGRRPGFRDWREGYDPDTWLDRESTRPAPRSSRCTASIRCPEFTADAGLDRPGRSGPALSAR